MRTDETKNEINEIKKWEGKIKGKGFKNKKKNKKMIFSNMKQLVLYALYQNLVINLGKEQQKVKIKKKDTYESEYALYDD